MPLVLSATRTIAGNILLNEVALARLLNLPTGPVGLDIKRRAENVAEKARRNASGGVVHQRTGNLADSVYVEPKEVHFEPGQVVGTDLPYGLWLEQGQDPRIISVNQAPVLRSDDLNPNPLIRRDLVSVSWPGYASKPWLSGALEEAAN